MPNKSKYELEYRPSTYWDTPEAVFANIKGARRALVDDARETDAIEDVPDALLDDSLSEGLREFTGSLHPCFMGGEYLPGYRRNEVEIARVSLESTTADVISIRARPVGKRIHYRVVDEYDSTYCTRPQTSRCPLRFRELIRLIDSTDRGYEGSDTGLTLAFLDSQVDYLHPDEVLGFVTVTSEFYPQLWSWYDEEESEWYGEALERLGYLDDAEETDGTQDAAAS